jgi:hypothetical protein
MKINGKETLAKTFAYDGCHKIYLIENEQQLQEARENEYSIRPIAQLKQTFENSCGLRFIDCWGFDKPKYVNQFEEAEFTP